MDCSPAVPQLFYFLRNDLGLSEKSLKLVEKYSKSSNSNLPMLLWQYGLISLGQLNLIFDWLDQRSLSV